MRNTCQVMDACLRCQSETKVDCRGGKDCVVVWGECNHSFHQVRSCGEVWCCEADAVW